MAYNEEDLVRLRHMKKLAQRIKGETKKLDDRIPEPVEALTNSELEEMLK